MEHLERFDYGYDNGNELTAASLNGTQTNSYAYDLNGNQTGTGYSTTTDNEQTASPGYTYTYDNAGNLIAQTNTSTHVMTTYTYDYRNRLTEVEVGGTIVATYTYDALGDRIGIDDNGTQTWTVYDGTNPYADFNGSGTLEERYQSGPGMVDGAVVDELLARTSASGTTAWYLTDKLDSVRDIVSSSGTELDHIVYDSFGNIVTETNASDGDRFKFAGMEYDSTTGRYYDRARGYDPTTGRFMGQDPDGFAAGSLNLSEYVGNDPTDLFDPTGLQGSDGTQSQQAPQAAAQQAAAAAAQQGAAAAARQSGAQKAAAQQQAAQKTQEAAQQAQEAAHQAAVKDYNAKVQAANLEWIAQRKQSDQIALQQQQVEEQIDNLEAKLAERKFAAIPHAVSVVTAGLIFNFSARIVSRIGIPLITFYAGLKYSSLGDQKAELRAQIADYKRQMAMLAAQQAVIQAQIRAIQAKIASMKYPPMTTSKSQ